VRLLLDTHVALWAIARPDRLTPEVSTLLEAPSNDVVVSVASLWEIDIKYARNRGRRGDMPVSGRQALRHFLEAGYAVLSILPEHALAVEHLPPLHADPFDRMLVAQAMTEPLKLVTHDAAVAAYSETILLF
jgi:PIN domain nuclease of toxin-antitoxin system